MIRIKPIRLRTWFPPDDPVATAVARLCVLREDLILELHGIVADNLEKVDGNSNEWRRMYFWRNSLRTLEEIKHSLNNINRQVSFRQALAREPAQVKTAFESQKKELNKTSQEVLGELRNTVSAHLDGGVMQDALDQMEGDREGLVEIGETVGRIHYKFTGELILAILLRGVPPKSQMETFKTVLGKSAKLSRAVSAIDDVFACYARDRRLRF
jgi:hypothetical protein